MHLTTSQIKTVGYFLLLWLAVATGSDDCYAKDSATVPAPNIIQVLIPADGRIFVLTDDKNGLFYSVDGGSKWEQALHLPDVYLYSVSEDANGHLFLATSRGIFRSNDGKKWAPAAALNAAFTVFPPKNAICYLKIWGKGLFLTSVEYFIEKMQVERKRADWEKEKAAKELSQLNSKIQQIWKLRTLPESPEERRKYEDQRRRLVPLLVQRDKLQKVLHQSGGSQIEKVEGLPQTPLQSLTYEGMEQVFAGFFGEGVYRSQDGGQKWEKINKGLTNRDVLTIQRSPEGILFAGTYGGGLFQFSETDQRWSRVDDGLINGIVQCIAFEPSGCMLIGTQEQGILISQDQGRTWTRPTGVLKDASIQALAVGSDGCLYAGTYGKGLFVSRDGGRTWKRRLFAYLEHVNQIGVDEAGGWYVDIKGLGVLRSTDAGKSWTEVVLPFSLDKGRKFAISGNALFAASDSKGPYVSFDQGNTWQEVANGLPQKGVHSLRVSDAGILYATDATGDRCYRLLSTHTWKKIDADDTYDYTARDLLFMPDGRVVVYGAYDILISRDGNAPWHRERFGGIDRGIWVDAGGTLWTERMISTFALSHDQSKWQKRQDRPPNRYTSFTRLSPDSFMAIRMDGGMDIVQWTGSDLIPVHRYFSEKRVLSTAVNRKRGILVGTDQGLWFSTDLGRTWQEITLEP